MRAAAQTCTHARTHFHRFINGLCDWRGKEARYRVLRTVMYIHVDRHRVVVRTTTATVTAAVAAVELFIDVVHSVRLQNI